MSRIRSIHPGFFKDERLVATSMAARLLFIGLGVEADDKGIFEWKPLTIKMLVFPGDNVDVSELLAELVAADAIRQYEIEGRKYGAIRNFRKFQKPKTPNDIHPITPEIGNYVSLTKSVSEAFPPKGEKSRQMEDGGGKREEGVGEERTETDVSGAEAPPVVSIDARTALFRHGRASLMAMTGKPDAACRQLIGKWLKLTKDDCKVVLEIIRDADELKPSDPVAWITKSVESRQPKENWRDDPILRGVL